MRPMFTSMAYINLTDGPGTLHRSRGGGALAPRPSHTHNRNIRRIAVAAIAGLVALALLAGSAQASESVFAPAPSYPSSTLAITAVGQPHPGGIVRVVVSGSNAPFEAGYPGSGDDIAYQLDAFAQNGNVLPTCPRSFSEELQNEINLGISRIAQGLPEGYFGAFSTPIQFQVGSRIRNVVVCAYSRLITDDAAVSALSIKIKARRHRRHFSGF